MSHVSDVIVTDTVRVSSCRSGLINSNSKVELYRIISTREQ
jgi:hypothetical protein